MENIIAKSLVLLLIGILFGCDTQNNHYPNLIVNPRFELLDSASGLPSAWSMEEVYNNHDMFRATQSKLHMTRNSHGPHYLFQDVNVEPNTFYKVSSIVFYDIKDYSKGGIYLLDELNTPFFKVEKAFAKGQDTLAFVFNSGTKSSVKLAIGFLGGMNGEMEFSNVLFIKHKFDCCKPESRLGQYLKRRLDLSFAEAEFDESVDKLTNYLNELLLMDPIGRIGKPEREVVSKYLVDEGLSYLPQYLAEHGEPR